MQYFLFSTPDQVNLYIKRVKKKFFFFFFFNWEFFFQLGKKQPDLHWEWGRISDPWHRAEKALHSITKVIKCLSHAHVFASLIENIVGLYTSFNAS